MGFTVVVSIILFYQTEIVFGKKSQSTRVHFIADASSKSVIIIYSPIVSFLFFAANELLLL